DLIRVHFQVAPESPGADSLYRDGLVLDDIEGRRQGGHTPLAVGSAAEHVDRLVDLDAAARVDLEPTAAATAVRGARSGPLRCDHPADRDVPGCGEVDTAPAAVTARAAHVQRRGHGEGGARRHG